MLLRLDKNSVWNLHFLRCFNSKEDIFVCTVKVLFLLVVVTLTRWNVLIAERIANKILQSL